MIDYLHSGGLPEFVNLRGEETKRHYVEAVKDTILLKDIVERHKIKDAALLDRIFLSQKQCFYVTGTTLCTIKYESFTVLGGWRSTVFSRIIRKIL